MEIDIIRKYIPQHLEIPTIESPQKTRYRNNILFSIGWDENDKIEVGPLLKSGIVKPARTNLLISDLGLKVCECVREYLTNYNCIPIFSKKTKIGFWRHIQIRENTEKEYFINFRFTNFSEYSDLLEKKKDELILFLKTYVPYHLIQINYQIILDKREPTVFDPIYNLYYEKDLYQKILGKIFIIDPLCFFQVNYSAAELMFLKVRELVSYENNELLLDLCCGIGIYSFLLQDKFRKVIGVDCNPNNIKIANDLKRYNPSNNITFIESRVENVISNIIKKKATIILNPSRSGLPLSVKDCIEKNKDYDFEIIYISCNVIRFMRSEWWKTFYISHVIRVNIFASTDSSEYILKIVCK